MYTKMLQCGVVIGCLVLGLSSGLSLNRTDCKTKETITAGEILLCDDYFYAVSSCGSGKNGDCGGGIRTRLTCCRELVTGTLTQGVSAKKACETSGSGNAGDNMECFGNAFVTGICGSGENTDCHFGNDRFYAMVRCCDVHSMTKGDPCFWQYQTHGATVECPSPTIAAGYCGSGENKDCNSDQSSHGLYCCTPL